MKILICDDERIFVDELKEKIERFANQRHFVCDIYATNNPVEVENDGNIYQIAFLDIQMEPIDGLALAKILKKRNKKTVLFFTTAYDVYQDAAMDVSAFRFFEKPVDERRLFSGLEKAIEYVNENYAEFWFTAGNKQEIVRASDILYVERKDRQVTLATVNGQYKTRENFEHWCELLQNSFFYKVHNSIIVNLNYVTSYKNEQIVLCNNVEIPVSLRRRADFRRAWFDFLQGC